MKLAMSLAVGCLTLLATAATARADTYFVSVAGLGGEPDYAQRFAGIAADLDRVLKAAGGGNHVITLSGSQATREHLRQALGAVAQQAQPSDVLVLMLVGHGSFDGTQYKFNLPGPDISARELAALCDRIRATRQLIVNTTSASGGSIAALQRHDRVVIAATKSGTEKNATVFARYWVEALQDPAADTDKSQSISALEAFEYAAAKTAAFYEQQKRLATEHAVFQEGARGPPLRAAGINADTGRLLASITLMRLGTGHDAVNDPAKRVLLARKEQLEQKIDLIKYQRAAMSPDDYRSQMTEALVALAKVQGALEK